MSKRVLFTVACLLFLVPVLCSAFEQSTLPKPSGGLDTQGNAPSVVPKPSEGPDLQGNTTNPTSRYLGIDSQGNTSVLTPNHSGGYIGVDSRGSAVTVTPLRGNLGVDSQGNIWTIRPR